MNRFVNRRGLLLGGAALGLSGCKVLDGLNAGDSVTKSVIASANTLTYRTQRLLGGGHTLAPEFQESDIRQSQHPNGVTNPSDEDYVAMAGNDFADYKLQVTGLVDKPLSLSRDALQAMPSKTQITRHDCVEGWSCIAKWTGVPLALVLNEAKPKVNARFAVFHCMDTIESSLSGQIKYYESIDMIDAYHPQTILAYGLNGSPLPVSSGAPLRVRIERQLGYKMAKYIHTIELVENFAAFWQGKGGYWEDRGYDWYGGI